MDKKLTRNVGPVRVSLSVKYSTSGLGIRVYQVCFVRRLIGLHATGLTPDMLPMKPFVSHILLRVSLLFRLSENETKSSCIMLDDSFGVCQGVTVQDESVGTIKTPSPSHFLFCYHVPKCSKPSLLDYSTIVSPLDPKKCFSSIPSRSFRKRHCSRTTLQQYHLHFPKSNFLLFTQTKRSKLILVRIYRQKICSENMLMYDAVSLGCLFSPSLSVARH